jgi:hypothetical protein
MDDNLQKILDELKAINRRIDSVNQDVQFIKSIFTTPRPTKTKKLNLSREEQTAQIIAKLLKVPHTRQVK